MPLGKLVIILISVVIAAGLTVWSAVMVMGASQRGDGIWLIVIPSVLIGSLVLRIILKRIGNSGHDRLDGQG